MVIRINRIDSRIILFFFWIRLDVDISFVLH